MKKRTFISALAALFTLTALAVPVEPAGAGTPPSGAGAIEFEVDVPDGGTALLEVRTLNGKELLATVVADEDGSIETEMPQGNYRIVPRQLAVDGERFVAAAHPLVVRVESGRTASTTVDYERSLGVQNLRVTEVTETSVSLDWEADLGDDTTVWRVEGDMPASKPGQGTEVELDDSSSLTDSGLEPGKVYSYSIFARPGDGAFGRNDVEPVSIVVSTNDADPTTPLFVLSPITQILGEEDFTPYSTGDSLILQLAEGLPTPTPDSILIVPVTEALPGGYLGQVVAVSADGRAVELVQAPMASAFDLYHLDVDALSSLPDPVFAPGAPEPVPADVAPSGSLQASSPKASCGSGSSGMSVTPSFSQEHDGRAKITIDKWKIRFFPDVPHTLNYDVGYTTTLSATVKVEATVKTSCSVDLPRFFKNVAYYPVPLALDVDPSASVSVFATGSVENLGGAVTAGFSTDGKLSTNGLPQVDGDLTFEGNATEPTHTGEGGFNLGIGGSVTFGPGVGSKDVGLVFGLSGDFSPLDATASVVVVEKAGQQDSCIKVEAVLKAGMSASLKAWVPGYSTDYSVTIDPLQGSWDWPGSPYWWPNDCTQSDEPTDDIVGDNLTVIDDSVVGGDEQFGKVEGFVPGETSWVLSTGKIQDVVGSPSMFASTSLGQPGDGDLSQFSGNLTYDAAVYQVTVVPNASTLVVRYAFGSEEYPEYVGSQFNDVMAVFVDGTNCALVPGTNTAVAINSVNQNTNSSYYIDNQAGAAGYGTTMDGLTVPLECRVPVTLGEQVTVKIAVADASDGIYDSAVALLDGGIYAE